MRFLIFALALSFGACSSSNKSPLHKKDGGTSSQVCPSSAEGMSTSFCMGKCCGGQCVDHLLDSRNCGGCGMTCTPGQVCVGGKCGCLPKGDQCTSAQTCCGGSGCANLQTDARHCGDCNKVCNDNESCVAGACRCGDGAPCTSGQQCCVDPGGSTASCKASCGGGTGDLDAGIIGGGGPPCECPSKTCALGCVGPDCCFEEAFLGAFGGTPICDVSPDCTPSGLGF